MIVEMTKLENSSRRSAAAHSHLRSLSCFFVAGEDVHLIDEQGNRYLDLLSGIGVNALGYSSKAIQEALPSRAAR